MSAPKRERASNQIFLSNHQNRYRLRLKIFKAAAQTALASLGYRRAIVSIAFVTDAQIKSLNRRFLNHDRLTDVLAFPFEGRVTIPTPPHPDLLPLTGARGYGFSPLPRGAEGEGRVRVGARLKRSFRLVLHASRRRNKTGSAYLGEVIISVKRAHVHASRFHSTFEEELIRYVCHGILHLAGLRDKTKKDQEKMRREENRLLRLTRAERKKG